jgi:hypothetical protein
MKILLALVCMLAAAIVGALLSPAFAEEISNEEKRLESSAGELDKKYSEGRDRVADKIKEQFGVDDARLLGMSYKKMSYGEIAIALGLAQDLHGGITDKNLYKIAALRQGPPAAGWGRIAKDLGLKLGPVINKVRKISSEVRRQEKYDEAKKHEKAEGEKMKKAERRDKAKKRGRRERSEKASMLSLMRS